MIPDMVPDINISTLNNGSFNRSTEKVEPEANVNATS